MKIYKYFIDSLNEEITVIEGYMGHIRSFYSPEITALFNLVRNTAIYRSLDYSIDYNTFYKSNHPILFKELISMKVIDSNSSTISLITENGLIKYLSKVSNSEHINGTKKEISSLLIEEFANVTELNSLNRQYKEFTSLQCSYYPVDNFSNLLIIKSNLHKDILYFSFEPVVELYDKKFHHILTKIDTLFIKTLFLEDEQKGIVPSYFLSYKGIDSLCNLLSKNDNKILSKTLKEGLKTAILEGDTALILLPDYSKVAFSHLTKEVTQVLGLD